MISEENGRIIEDCRIELDKISTWIKAHPVDDNIKYLVGYAVVKASGTIEIVMKSMLYDFLSENVKAETQTYLTKSIVDSSCNPNTGNIGKILDQIDSSRRNNLEVILKQEINKEKGDLNSLVQLRNDLAHGRSVNSSINGVKTYYESGITILQQLDNILYPND